MIKNFLKNVFLKPKQVSIFEITELWGIVQLYPSSGVPEVLKRRKLNAKIFEYKRIIVSISIGLVGTLSLSSFALRVNLLIPVYGVICFNALAIVSALFAYKFKKHLDITKGNIDDYNMILTKPTPIKSDELKIAFTKFIKNETEQRYNKVVKIKEKLPNFGDWFLN